MCPADCAHAAAGDRNHKATYFLCVCFNSLLCDARPGAAQDAWLRRAPFEGFPHYAVQHKPPGQSVIGSQPVSLDRENLELLRRKRCVLCCAGVHSAVPRCAAPCCAERAVARRFRQGVTTYRLALQVLGHLESRWHALRHAAAQVGHIPHRQGWRGQHGKLQHPVSACRTFAQCLVLPCVAELAMRANLQLQRLWLHVLTPHSGWHVSHCQARKHPAGPACVLTSCR